tara:strand:+ start:1379 stop:2722 length:1344 start_codon:yes stop_codon:yes gene_type:complete
MSEEKQEHIHDENCAHDCAEGVNSDTGGLKEKDFLDSEQEKAAPFNLNLEIFNLLQEEPFWAALSRRIDKRASRAIPTAGVRINPVNGQLEMIYNPEFFVPLDKKQRTGVIVHEYSHLIYGHLDLRRPTDEEVTHKDWNIATDLAINGLLGPDRLPEGCCIPGVGPMFTDYPTGLSSEAYLEMLKKDEKYQESKKCQGNCQPGGQGEPCEGECNCGGEGQFDSHDEWDKTDSVTKDMAKERLKGYMKGAAQECGKSNSWGTVSAEMRKEIMRRITTTVDWKKVMRAFIGRSQRSDKSNSIRRINRRFPYIHPGRKINRVANIAISIDMSGSVGDNMLGKFFAELNKLSELATFTVIPFDHEVFEEKIFVWKKGQSKQWERVLCGGTCFGPPTEYVNKNHFEGHIILTDGYADTPPASKPRRMWLIPESCKDSQPWTNNEIKVWVKDC